MFVESARCGGSDASLRFMWHVNGTFRARSTLVQSTTLTLVLLGVLLGLVGCQAAHDTSSSVESDVRESDARFVGSWRLQSWTDEEGVERCADEGGATGQIVYTADGHMSAQLGCAQIDLEDGIDVQDDADGEGASSDVLMTALRQRITLRHFSYYGSYTIDDERGVVIHHVLGSVSPSWVGTEQERAFDFESPQRLVLSPVDSEMRLTWQRNL